MPTQIDELKKSVELLLSVNGTMAGVILGVLVFFWQTDKLKNQKGGMVVSLLCECISVLFLLVTYAFVGNNNYEAILKNFLWASIFCAGAGLIILPLTFARAHLRYSALRERRMLNYIIPKKILNKIKDIAYIERMIPRSNVDIFGLNIDKDAKDMIYKGYSFLLLVDSALEDRVKNLAIRFSLQGIKNGETVDYVCTDCHPFQIKTKFYRLASQYNYDLSKIHKDDLIIIDAFTEFYGFKEDVLAQRADQTREEVHVIKAKSVAGIHSAAIDAWYRHRKRVRKTTGKLRRPHIMIYDHLLALSDKFGNEQLKEYFFHLISAEKEFGMFTIIIEYKDKDNQLINELEQRVDCCMETIEDANGNKTYLEIKKMRLAKIEKERIEI